MNLIASADNAWGIGKNGGLLYRIPKDMEFFRKTTINKAVVMGRKTLDSLPDGIPLKDRENIVLTRDLSFAREGVAVCHSINEIIERAGQYPPDFVYVIGGGEIFSILLPYCKRAYITKIGADFNADTYMPNLDKIPSWIIIKSSRELNYKGISYRFTVYEKK